MKSNLLSLLSLGFEPRVSLLVPAVNEEATIATTVQSMAELNYPGYEVIVINIGPWDGTPVELRRVFALVAFPEAYWERIEARHRQLNSIRRLWNLLRWLAGAKGQGREIRRTASSHRGP
jgi:cellulose synthase/poly-beta-1,6-N-acetylglucosamine synthase-like glycosyltransferase